MSSKELIEKLKTELDITVKSAQSNLDEKQVKLVREFLQNEPDKSDKPEITLANCENVKIFVKELLGFRELEYELPLNDTYAKFFIGRNGCGKSNLLSILGTLVMPSFLKERLHKDYLTENSLLRLEFQLKTGEIVCFEQKGKDIGNWTNSNEKYKFKAKYGFFEPPIDSIRGVRKISKEQLYKKYKKEELVKLGKHLMEEENEREICRVMNWVLSGREDGKFSYLYRIPGKSITDSYFFLKKENKIIPFEFFSTGEKFLLRILTHIVRTYRAKWKDLPRPIIIDEIELSLHPFAQARLAKYILELVKGRRSRGEKPHIPFLISTHSYSILQELIRLGEEKTIVLIESHSALSKTFLIPWEKAESQEDNRKIFSIEKRLLEVSIKNSLSCKKSKLLFVVEDKEIAQLLEILLADKLDFIPIEAGGYTEVFQRAREISSIKELVGFFEVIAIVDGDVEEEEVEKHEGIMCYKLPIKSIRKEFFSLIRTGRIKITNIFELMLPEKAEEIENEIKTATLDNSDDLRNLWKGIIKKIRRNLGLNGQSIGRDEQIEKTIIRFLIRMKREEFEKFAEKITQEINKLLDTHNRN